MAITRVITEDSPINVNAPEPTPQTLITRELARSINVLYCVILSGWHTFQVIFASILDAERRVRANGILLKEKRANFIRSTLSIDFFTAGFFISRGAGGSVHTEASQAESALKYMTTYHKMQQTATGRSTIAFIISST